VLSYFIGHTLLKQGVTKRSERERPNVALRPSFHAANWLRPVGLGEQRRRKRLMTGRVRRVVAFHEAGHAVVTRHFGLKVIRVAARRRQSEVPSESAAWLATGLDASEQIRAYEKDAIIALAGLAAQRQEHPA
jgi:hypothetical protein